MQHDLESSNIVPMNGFFPATKSMFHAKMLEVCEVLSFELGCFSVVARLFNDRQETGRVRFGFPADCTCLHSLVLVVQILLP